MDWMKLVGVCIVLYMAIEILKVKLPKLKPVILRVLILFIVAVGSAGAALAAPVVVGGKYTFVFNFCMYFIVEYFMFLFLKNELQFSVKDFLLSKLRGAVPVAQPEKKDDK